MFLIFVGLIFCQCSGVRIEAEDGVIYDGATKFLDDDSGIELGYSGTGYVEFRDSGGICVTFDNINAGLYNLVIGYNGKYGEKNQDLFVNGQSLGQIAFPASTSFGQFIAKRKLNLEGSVVINITKSWGWVIMDYFDLIPFEAADFPSFNIDPNLVNPNSIVQAVELYEFLKSNFGKKVISGTMTLQGGEEYSLREANWLYATTLKWPALLGLDFMHQTGKDSAWYYDDPIFSRQVVRDASDYFSRGGIVHLMWHWRDPSRVSHEFYTESMTFDAEKAVIEGTPEYEYIIADLDVIAEQLLELQTKGVAVLWRPLHEAAGGWFWWGSKGPEVLKKLWMIMYDRFTYHHGLNNLIWVWTTEPGKDDPDDWYPGDDYVDIVGVDIYTRTVGTHGSQMPIFEKMRELHNATKIIALTECDSTPDPDEMSTDAAYWSFIMPWYGNYIIPGGDPPQSSVDFWRLFMTHDIVLTLDQMPGWAKVDEPKEPIDAAWLYSMNLLHCLLLCLLAILFI